MNRDTGPDHDDEAPERPSKSQRKREFKGLQALADRLAGLADGELQRLGIGEGAQGPVAAAIANAVYHATGVRVTHTPLNPIQTAALLAANPQMSQLAELAPFLPGLGYHRGVATVDPGRVL